MSDFQSDFLEHYLNLGLGSMPKSDVDALVMHLLDKYGYEKSTPMAKFDNQTVSQTLKTPIAKVKKLRYDAALKFGGRVEDEAKGKLLVALSRASLESQNNKICLIIEDTLAKNWLQGQLKIHQLIFDHSFNTEIIKVSKDGLFEVLKAVFDPVAINTFEKASTKAIAEKDDAKKRELFKKGAIAFAKAAATKAGGPVAAIVTPFLA